MGDFLLDFFNQWQTSIENFEFEKLICKEPFANYVDKHGEWGKGISQMSVLLLKY